MKIRAIHIADRDTFMKANDVPGSFCITDPDGDGEMSFWYRCPCGCGMKAPILVGNGFKPDMSPSWQWNGSFEAPTLQPSVNHVGHWHGWLTDGFWVLA